jgi:methyl-accepting chemotaxis protein
MSVDFDYPSVTLDTQSQQLDALWKAINRSQAIIEFDLQGRVVSANANFLDLMGYTLDEIVGQHHRIFCDPAEISTPEYRTFWQQLAQGELMAGEYRRLTQSGKEVWLQATYNPVHDADGKPYRVIKMATDISAEKHLAAEYEGKVNAMDRALAVIEFDLKGNILSANRNFLDTMGYQADDIIGHHHRMFCEPDYVTSREYRDFWQSLGRGEFFSGRFMRFGNHGRRVWIQATYNPIFNADGAPYKVVKFATDITDQVELEEHIQTLTEAMSVSLQQLNASIASIAENTQLTRELARATQQEAEHGTRSLDDSRTAMTAIQKSSEDINDIVQVIGEIASQTNLLAFNAAIEAVRAGEHGLGFSVVADEVRKLAEKSADATRQINRLLGESLKRIESGNTVSQRAADSFGRIVDGVGQTTASVEKIASSAGEQLETAKHVDNLIRDLAQATQRGSGNDKTS